jgi:signal transduction histidine kinase
MLVRKKDPATVPPAAFEVLDSAQQAVSLINDLLDLSRLDEDRLRVTIRSVELAPVIRGAVGRVTPAARQKKVRVMLELATGMPPSATDATRLEQILVNLLANGIRHARDKGQVTVQSALDEARRKIIITVDDDGPGVAPENAELIFDIYVTRPGEESQGVGLGLPLSRRLARLLGGELTVVPRPGEGGRFLLELPVAES